MTEDTTEEQPLELADTPGMEELDVAPSDDEEAVKKELEEAQAASIALPEARPGGAPVWVKIPPNFRFPKSRQVMFIRFKQEWTDAPHKGERQAICWAISAADKKMALQRAMGDPNRASDELAKQMVRAVDGNVVDWSGAPTDGNIDVWWNEIGEKCRSLLIKIFMQLHILTREETKDFFESCIAVRSTG